jgi:hypothetical protein
MPTISMFYGIIIRMFVQEHQPPHFHATYGEFEATFNFDGEKTKGNMPKAQIKLIQAWAEIHKKELEANWTIAVAKEELFKIDPLK